MNANNINKYILLVIVFLLFSCKEKQQTSSIKEENTYQIIGLLLNDLRESIVLHPGFAPPPGGATYNFTTKDSLRSYNYFYKQTIRKKTIAFWPQIYPLEKKHKKNLLKTIKKCTTDNQLITPFSKSENNIEIDINKIANSKKDSLIYYTEKHKEMLRRGYEEIDMMLSFSDITFNKDYTKAIIIVGVTFESLNGFSRLVYLEKKHYHWEIKCEEGLSIS
ncbi:hypothetical protein [Tenacibaculum ovolyticum]|uniref:hypothetical protein n=1 Tax=Tenacibaculum ovolyticum TaxID=104270 RepID=UPI0007EC622A|nr:hypothetical protein [Tenacibaculum ovolyticum]